MLKIDLSKRAGDFLTDLPPKQCKQVFTTILKLSQNPRPHDSKKLQGYDDLYRTDIGEYRIVYQFNTEVLSINVIGKRNDDEVYAQLKRISK